MIENFKNNNFCPLCKKRYGITIGSQPHGFMDIEYDKLSLPGYEDHGKFIMTFMFPNGIQDDRHPDPGEKYTGTTRIAYLPDVPEGYKILKLITKAFEQNLLFTIGSSLTNGSTNIVTFGNIHLKTSQSHDSVYGFPDPTYFSRVKEELAQYNITCSWFR